MKLKGLAAFGATIGMIVGVLTLTEFVNFSAPGLFVFAIGTSFLVDAIWEYKVFREVDTYYQIVENRNIAYAIVRLIPALLCIAGALAMQG